MGKQQEREELKKAYPNSPDWHQKVDKMPDAQVVAIYIRKKSKRELGK